MRTILLTSYTYSGITWLQNCFMELGILVKSPEIGNFFEYVGTESPTHDKYKVKESALKLQGYPALDPKRRFLMRKDVKLHTLSHELPSATEQKNPTLCLAMVRDPRDTLLSQHRLETTLGSTTLSFPEFANAKLVEWICFYAALLSHPNMHFVKFEEYKKDAENTLASVIETCEIDIDEEAIAKACAASSYEKAKAAELRTMAANQTDDNEQGLELFSSGKTAKYLNHPEYRPTFQKIDYFTAPIRQQLGYPEHNIFRRAVLHYLAKKNGWKEELEQLNTQVSDYLDTLKAGQA